MITDKMNMNKTLTIEETTLGGDTTPRHHKATKTRLKKKKDETTYKRPYESFAQTL